MSGKKKKHLFAAVTSFVLIFVMSVALGGCQSSENGSVSSENNGNNAAESSKVLDYRETDYTVKDAKGGIVLKNNYDGFSVKLPADYKKGVDVTAVSTEAGNRREDISIFRETFRSEDEFKTYRDYSNKPVKKSDLYTITDKTRTKEPGRTVYTLAWKRDPIGGIKNDRPYYCCVDILYKGRLFSGGRKYTDYTLYFRSASPLSKDKIDEICSSFKKTETKKHILTSEPRNKSQKLNVRSYWAGSTKDFYTSHFSKDAPLDWGVFNPNYWNESQGEHMKNLSQTEAETGCRFDILVWYYTFGIEDINEQTRRIMDSAENENRVLELTIQTDTSKGGSEVYKMLNGGYDQDLIEIAEAVRDHQQPVLFRFGNEMNGDWCGYSAYNYARDTELYIEMYRYVYNKLQEYGALPYTIMVWNPNEKSLPAYNWNHEYRYYPGDKYVDVVGLTGYNTGTYYDGETWRTFDEIYRKPYLQDVVNYTQPLMITEFACSSVGGNKVKWMKDMFSELPSYSRIKTAIWWNGCDFDKDGKVARPYWFDETGDTLKAFTEGVRRSEEISESSASAS